MTTNYRGESTLHRPEPYEINAPAEAVTDGNRHRIEVARAAAHDLSMTVSGKAGPRLRRAAERTAAVRDYVEHATGLVRRLADDDISNPDGLDRVWGELAASFAPPSGDAKDAIREAVTELLEQTEPARPSAQVEQLARQTIEAIGDDVAALEEAIETERGVAFALRSKWGRAHLAKIAERKGVEQILDAASSGGLNVDHEADRRRAALAGLEAARQLELVRQTEEMRGRALHEEWLRKPRPGARPPRVATF
jgi:hypothetical protein